MRIQPYSRLRSAFLRSSLSSGPACGQQSAPDILDALKGHTDTVRPLRFPDGTLIATASFDRNVRLFEASTGKEIRTLAASRDTRGKFSRSRSTPRAIRSRPAAPTTSRASGTFPRTVPSRPLPPADRRHAHSSPPMEKQLQYRAPMAWSRYCLWARKKAGSNSKAMPARSRLSPKAARFGSRPAPTEQFAPGPLMASNRGVSRQHRPT